MLFEDSSIVGSSTSLGE